MRNVLIVTLSLLLAACGGGGGSDSIVGSDSTTRPEGTLFIQLRSSPEDAGELSGGGYYYPGETASLTADADSNFRFKNWTLSSSILSTNSNTSFEVRNDAVLTANFEKLYVYSAEVVPKNAGFVLGTGNYSAGEVVKLVAVPAEEYSFAYWRDADENIISSSASYEVTAQNRKQNYEAVFKINQYRISTIPDPVIGGQVFGEGRYDFQNSISLSAQPSSGYVFSGWFSGSKLISSSENLLWSVKNDEILTAKFAAAVEVQLNASITNAGTLTGTGSYSEGQTVRISAAPNLNHWFSHWEEGGDKVSLNATHRFVIKESRSFSAIFVPGSRPARVRAISGGFAAIYPDGSVKTWGRAQSGGDSSTVQSELTSVRDASGTGDKYGMSAAIRKDGSVVRWGYGVPNGVVDNLTDVEELYVTSGVTSRYMFARKANGDVISIGQETPIPGTGIKRIESIVPNRTSFAGIRFDRTVAAWGGSSYGGQITGIEDELVDVISIAGSSDAYAALKSDKTVISWGSIYTGGDSSAVASELNNVRSIHANYYSFVALKEDGTVVNWGDSDFGGDSSGVATELVGVDEISSSRFAWAALRNNGTVVAWGRENSGGDTSSVSSQLMNIKSIESNGWGFAAITEDNKVVSWGSNLNTSSVDTELYDIEKVVPSGSCFAALRSDKKVFSWGPSSCSDTSTVDSELRDVVDIVPNGNAFVALRSDGTLVAWGDEDTGGKTPD